MKPQKYRKKQLVILALLWTGTNHDDVNKFCADLVSKQPAEATAKETLLTFEANKDPKAPVSVFIRTPEGMMTGQPGDYIVQRSAGEFSIVTAAMFADDYELIPQRPETPVLAKKTLACLVLLQDIVLALGADEALAATIARLADDESDGPVQVELKAHLAEIIAAKEAAPAGAAEITPTPDPRETEKVLASLHVDAVELGNTIKTLPTHHTATKAHTQVTALIARLAPQ